MGPTRDPFAYRKTGCAHPRPHLDLDFYMHGDLLLCTSEHWEIQLLSVHSWILHDVTTVPYSCFLDPLMTCVHLIHVLSVCSRMLTTEAAKISHSFLFPVSFLPLGQDTSMYLSRVINRIEQAFMREAHVTPHKRFVELLLSAHAPKGHMWFISSRVTCSVTAHYKSNMLKLQKWLSSQELKPVLNYSSLQQWQDQYTIIFGEAWS